MLVEEFDLDRMVFALLSVAFKFLKLNYET